MSIAKGMATDGKEHMFGPKTWTEVLPRNTWSEGSLPDRLEHTRFRSLIEHFEEFTSRSALEHFGELELRPQRTVELTPAINFSASSQLLLGLV